MHHWLTKSARTYESGLTTSLATWKTAVRSLSWIFSGVHAASRYLKESHHNNNLIVVFISTSKHANRLTYSISAIFSNRWIRRLWNVHCIGDKVTFGLSERPCQPPPPTLQETKKLYPSLPWIITLLACSFWLSISLNKPTTQVGSHRGPDKKEEDQEKLRDRSI